MIMECVLNPPAVPIPILPFLYASPSCVSHVFILLHCACGGELTGGFIYGYIVLRVVGVGRNSINHTNHATSPPKHTPGAPSR